MIIIINGGPGSGKDVLAKGIRSSILEGSALFKFQDLIHEMAWGLLGLAKEQYFSIYNDRTKKEVPQPEFLGFSPRGLAQTIAEKMIKPNMGPEVFVDSVIAKIENTEHPHVIIPDLGFQEELDKIDLYFPLDKKVCIRLHRVDYNGDTRSSLDCRNNNVEIINLYQETQEEQLNIVLRFLEKTGLDLCWE